MVMKRSSRRKKTLSESLADKAGGNVYSLDIWHLISEYIRPEDVAKFSAICRNSWSVVNTATFWFKLYRRSVNTENINPMSSKGLYHKIYRRGGHLPN